jgi:hypothetical protein
MRKPFSPILMLAVCIFSVPLVFGQSKLLNDYRFEDGGYEFIGIFAHMNDHPLQKKLGEFYTNDISVLNDLKNAWVFKRPQRQYACGYHYYVLILRHGEVVKDFSINLECHELASENGSLYFDFNKLEAFSSRLKPLYSKQSEFGSVSEAREYWHAIQSNKNFVYADKPKWLQFEGEFRFHVRCSEKTDGCYKYADEMIPKLKAEIATRFPNEEFELSPGGGSNDELFVTIRCGRTLEEKFDLYDRWNKEAFGKWEAYPLMLLSYWKQPVETNSPSSK